MTDQPIPMAVVGLGLWGMNHVAAYARDPRCRLEIVCDRDEARAREVASTYGCRWTTSLDDVVGGGVVAAGVATPDHVHAEVVHALLGAGIHVLVEKPLSTDLAEAKSMTEHAARAGVVAMVDYHNRWNPDHLTVKAAIEDGSFGAPLYGYYRLANSSVVAHEWLSWAGNSGPEWFLFPHAFDLMRWMLEREPTSVFARGRRGILDSHGITSWDAIQASWTFDDVFITFETSWVVPRGVPSVVDAQLTLYGTSSKVDYLQSAKGLAISNDDRYGYPWVDVGQPNRYGQLDHFIYGPMRTFIDAIQGTMPVTSTFADGLASVAMIEATLRSVREGREVRLDEVL